MSETTIPLPARPARASTSAIGRAVAPRQALVRPAFSWSIWLAPAAFLAAGVAALGIDLAVAAQCRARIMPSFVKEILYHAESFGHAVGVILILVGTVQIDRRNWTRLPRLISCSLGAGLAANVIKLLVSRTRPNALPPETQSALATFGELLPGLRPASQQSFPSAHTSTAVGLAVALSASYPGGRLFFAAMAFLCAMHRVNGCAHFVSDVCVGAAVGWIVSSWCLRAPAFDRLEQKLAAKWEGRAIAE